MKVNGGYSIHEVTIGNIVKNKNGYSQITIYDRDKKELIDCVKVPNWGLENLKPGDIGYAKIRRNLVGENMWYDIETNSYIHHRKNMIQFIDFIKKAL